jgi:Uma2 family endonuclease
MTAALALDHRFPNLRPEVVEGYLNAPEHLVAEVLDGELFVMPRPRVRHASAASVLGEELGPPFRRGRGGPGGWVFLDEPELHLGPLPDILVPDLGGWRREQVPDDFLALTAIALAPHWVCEVLSPSTTRHDVDDKLPAYWRHGVAHVWFLDPEARRLVVHRRALDGWTLALTAGDADRVRAEPFDAVELDLALLWRL